MRRGPYRVERGRRRWSRPALVGLAAFLSFLVCDPGAVHRGSPTRNAFADILPTADVVLFLDGPNDGETLGNHVSFHFQSTYMGPVIVYFYKDDRYVQSFWSAAATAGFGFRSIVYSIDTTRFESGAASFEFYFFSASTGVMIGTHEYHGVIENPSIALDSSDESSEGGILPVRLHGRTGDQYFRLEAATATDCLLTVPTARVGCDGRVEALAAQPFGVSDGGAIHETVIDLDSLYRFHGSDVKLVLWTYRPKKGWARSRVSSPAAIASSNGSGVWGANGLQVLHF